MKSKLFLKNHSSALIFSFRLTPREQQIAEYLLAGKTAKESAQILGLSARTIESYVNTLKNKLGCQKRSELILKLFQLLSSSPISIQST